MLRLFFPAFALVACLAAQPLLAQGSASAADTRATKPTVLVNLNTATLAELETLPGIGPKVAARIIDYRQKKGPFRKIEEIMNVQGVGEKSFLRLRPQLTVAAKPDSAGQH